MRTYLFFLFMLLTTNFPLFAQKQAFFLREKVEKFWIDLSNIQYAEEKESYIRELCESWGDDIFTYNGHKLNFLDFVREIDKQTGKHRVSYNVSDFSIESQNRNGKRNIYVVEFILEQTKYNDENEYSSFIKSSMELGIYKKRTFISRINNEPYYPPQKAHTLFQLTPIGTQYVDEYAGTLQVEIPSKKIRRTYVDNNKYEDKIINNKVPLIIEKVKGYRVNATIEKNILSVRYPSNFSKEIRSFSIFLKQETSGETMKVVIMQKREKRYNFPSIIYCNNEYQGWEGGLLYNPDMPFGVYGGYIYNKFYFGGQVNCSLGTFKSINRSLFEPTFQVNNEEQSTIIPYNSKYDIEGKTKMHHDEYMFMGNIGYFLNDYLQVNIGIGFSKYKNLYITKMESVKDIIMDELRNNASFTENETSIIGISWSSKGHFYMHSNKNASIALRTGVKFYLPVTRDEQAISIGCSYNYIPNILKKHSFELSLGFLFNNN